MFDHLSECTQNLFLGAPAAANATSLVSRYINGSQCRELNVFAMVTAGGAADAANQLTVEMLMAEDSAGTNAETVKFQDVYMTVGDTALIDGTGNDTRIETVDADGIRGKVSSYQLDVAHGDKEVQLNIPIRSRMRDLVKGKPWIAMRVTTGGGSRDVTFFASKYQPDYGREVPTPFLK